MKRKKSIKIKDRPITLKPEVIVTCFLLIIFSFSDQSYAELSIYYSENTFLSNAPIVSTESFDSFPTGSGFDETEVVVDDVVYIANEGYGPCDPLPCWRFSDGFRLGPLMVTPPNIFLSNNIDKDIISFGTNKICKAFGFYFHSVSSADWFNEYCPDLLGWEIIVKEADGATSTIYIDPDIVGGEDTYPPYFGFVSSVGIKEISIIDIEGDGTYVNWAYDNVSRSDIEIEILSVAIDIKPGSDRNRINLKSRGKVPVAILTTDEFDAYDVAPDTCVFADAAPVRWRMKDVDCDGDYDMVIHFKKRELELNKNSTEATLECETYEELLITGTDSVIIVPKGKPKKKKAKKTTPKGPGLFHAIFPPPQYSATPDRPGKSDDSKSCPGPGLQQNTTTAPLQP